MSNGYAQHADQINAARQQGRFGEWSRGAVDPDGMDLGEASVVGDPAGALDATMGALTSRFPRHRMDRVLRDGSWVEASVDLVDERGRQGRVSMTSSVDEHGRTDSAVTADDGGALSVEVAQDLNADLFVRAPSYQSARRTSVAALLRLSAYPGSAVQSEEDGDAVAERLLRAKREVLLADMHTTDPDRWDEMVATFDMEYRALVTHLEVRCRESGEPEAQQQARARLAALRTEFVPPVEQMHDLVQSGRPRAWTPYRSLDVAERMRALHASEPAIAI